MNKFLIYKNPYKDKDETIKNKVVSCLLSLGAAVTDFDKYNGEYGDDLMTIVLGGDGTILQAIREADFSMGPVIGINLGTLGFLTEIETSNIENAMKALVEDKFTLEDRLLLEGKTAQSTVNALNDVVLTRFGGLRINSFNLYVNGLFLAQYFADGVIISTPTGSTGYNLSAGGPIASPASELIILTPICPHTLNHRSIILSSKDEVRIEIPASKDGGNQELEVSFDGSSKEIVKTGESVTVRCSDKKVCFAKLGKDSFLDILNRKMSEK